MAQLLVVHSDERSTAELVLHLLKKGHQVACAATGHGGLARARSDSPELVIIAEQLPDMTGADLCREIRQTSTIATTPVIIASEGGEPVDVVTGFEVGADDYLVKPYSLRELELRVRAILRRKPRTGRAVESPKAGAMKLDPAASAVWVGSEEVLLSPREMKLLTVLCDRPGHVHTREFLLHHAWGDTDGLSIRTVDASLKRLRRKLGPAGRFIETVRGVGYRLTTEDDHA